MSFLGFTIPSNNNNNNNNKENKSDRLRLNLKWILVVGDNECFSVTLLKYVLNIFHP